MKKTLTLSSIIALVILLLIQTNGNDAHSNNGGAPASRTGSPSDGQTCGTNGCHSATATPSATQIISSNVPLTGYIGGQTYTITAACAQTGINRYGFQISPQAVNGALQGQLIVTSPTTTKIVSTKYITHTSSGTAGAGGKTWSFNWVAPVVGTGDVTFYGAFIFANNNGSSSGDVIRTNTLVIPEDQSTTGIAPVKGDELAVILYPNPIQTNATLRINLKAQEIVFAKILSLNGQLIDEPVEFFGIPGMNEFAFQVPSNLNRGTYKLMVTSGNASTVKTFFKK